MKRMRGLGCGEIISSPSLGFVQPGGRGSQEHGVCIGPRVRGSSSAANSGGGFFHLGQSWGVRSGRALDSPPQTPVHSRPLVGPLPRPPPSMVLWGQASRSTTDKISPGRGGRARPRRTLSVVTFLLRMCMDRALLLILSQNARNIPRHGWLLLGIHLFSAACLIYG